MQQLCGGGQIIGFIAYYSNSENKFAYIPLIAVTSFMRKQGVGKMMLDALKETLPTDFTQIGLEVLKSNDKAIKFYRRYGFEMVEDRENKWLMQLKLLRP